MENSAARKIFLAPVRFYRKFISPAIGHNCIYQPSCSDYFIQCVEKFGIIRGSILGTARILRCSRFFLGGEDPVPETFSFSVIKYNRIRFRRHLRRR